jgi:Fur family ferric uptake transcriptional regulator
MKMIFKLELVMERSKSYNTKQKDVIINLIKSKKHSFTAKEIYNDLNKEVGLTTIYRLIDSLVNDEILTKNINSNNEASYQILENCDKENHFYLKCDNCGDLIHIDCDYIEPLKKHIFDEHNFKLNDKHIIINGTCDSCSKKEVKNEKN